MADKAPEIQLPPITILASGANDAAREKSLNSVLASPGYAEMMFMLVEVFERRVETVLLDYRRDLVAFRFCIDGVWHEFPDRDRVTGDYLLAVLKRLADLDYTERRARQHGEFGAKYKLKTMRLKLTSQGVKTGERVLLEVVYPGSAIEKFEQTTIRKSMLDQWNLLLRESSGFVLTSAMPGDGKSTIWRCTMHAADRFTRDFFAFEAKGAKEQDVINVEAQLYDAAAGETPLVRLPQALLRQPDVLCLPDLVSGEVLDEFLEQAIDHEKFVIGHVPARNATEALVRVLAMGTTPEFLAKTIHGVLYQRVIRKLCDTCRQPYDPPPELLRKLGIRPGRVQAFFAQWQPPPPEQCVDEKGNPIEIPICPKCFGVGFLGRTAIYELLVINDEIREALKRKPTLAELTQITAKHHVELRDEGVVLVAKGVTSVEELQRVLQR